MSERKEPEVVVIFDEDLQEILKIDSVSGDDYRIEGLERAVKAMLACGIAPRVGDNLVIEGMYESVVPYEPLFEIKKAQYVYDHTDDKFTIWIAVE